MVVLGRCVHGGGCRPEFFSVEPLLKGGVNEGSREVRWNELSAPPQLTQRGRVAREAAENEAAAPKLTRECLRLPPLRRKFR